MKILNIWYFWALCALQALNCYVFALYNGIIQ